MARGLGKGLDALLSGNIDQTDDEVITEVSPDECRPNPYQPRKLFDAEAIEELKQSILEHGIIQPLVVRKSIKGYEIVVGERRYRAAKAAKLEKIPVIIKEMDDGKMMELALLENLQREDLTPIEEAQAYVNLMKELDLTQEQLSNRLGKSRSHIANTIRLLSLPSEVVTMISEGELSMGHGRALLGLKEKESIEWLAGKTMREKLNVRQVEHLVTQLNEHKTAEQKKPKKKKDIFLVERESYLRERFGTAVSIQRGKKKGKIEIEFYNDEDLERILEMLDK